MALSFGGGIHPPYKKELTKDKPIVQMPAPDKLYIPVQQHIGAPCAPTVKVGDLVLKGQVIADSSAPVSSPIHSSVSGKVTAIGEFPTPTGNVNTMIVIENDGKEALAPEIAEYQAPDADSLTPEELVARVRAAGLVGMGGAGFPTHFKIKSALGKIDHLLINGAECEPYLSSDHRLMLEHPEEVVGGAKLLMKCFGLSSATICIEDNKLDAAAQIKKAAKDTGVIVQLLKTKYPQGGEKQIIKAVTRREVPGGKLPADVGCAVFNVDSAASVFRAVTKGMPVISRIVTVTGDAIANPKVLQVALGTTFQQAIDFCGGFVKEPQKIISGGPMMGIAQYSLDVPITKTTSGILALTKEQGITVSEPKCIRCGRCVAVCPVHLEPLYLSLYTRAGEFEEAKANGALDCIECGSCAFECPARLNLVSEIRFAKQKITDAAKKAQQEAKK